MRGIFHVFFLLGGMLCMQAQEFSERRLTGKIEVAMVDDLSGLQPEVIAAFEKMAAAAAKDGIKLKVVSGFRSFQRQKEIWNEKYRTYRKEGLTPPQVVEKITEYSTIPGTSRHHWGTDMDIVDDASGEKQALLVPAKFEAGGPFFKMKQWMDAHAATFGFYLVYTDDPGRKGFHYEPWHYSYAPLSKPMLQAFLKLDLDTVISMADLHGKQLLYGAVLRDYKKGHLMDINPLLKN